MARSIEELGYRTVWQGSSPGSDLRPAGGLLDATESLVVATGIVNIWKSDAAELADSCHRIQGKHPGRLLLGIGTGHREALARKVPSTSVARVHGAITAAARGRADRQERGVVVPVALEVVCQPLSPTRAPRWRP
jgi:alkanesulfonate monooxygenase SsuD/methylene tetrahydromethanopterin reductase-like flavin-dependent oxidoreductase (luciferase family)